MVVKARLQSLNLYQSFTKSLEDYADAGPARGRGDSRKHAQRARPVSSGTAFCPSPNEPRHGSRNRHPGQEARESLLHATFSRIRTSELEAGAARDRTAWGVALAAFGALDAPVGCRTHRAQAATWTRLVGG